MLVQRRTGDWRDDFRRLRVAYTISQLGSGIGTGELAIVAVLVVHAPVWQVSALAAISGLAAAAILLPVGPAVEFHRKRPTMITADVARFLALGSVPIAAWMHVLTMTQLWIVGIVQVCGAMIFRGASVAHLKALVPPSRRGGANGDLEVINWAAGTAGPPVGGVLISAFGAAAMVALDAVSFLLSAGFVRSLRSTEPPPPTRGRDRHWATEITAGWSYIFTHRVLRPLFINGMIYGSGILWVSPLLTVLMLRELKFAVWQYSLSLGIQGAGGLLGALWSRRLSVRHSPVAVMLFSGTIRCLPLGLLAIAPAGWGGWALITASETIGLFSAGVFNPTFGTYRMTVTDDQFLTRVTTAWSISSKVAQPLMIIVGGILAALTNVRLSLATAAALVMVSVAFLPWSQRRPLTQTDTEQEHTPTPAGHVRIDQNASP